MLISDCVSFPGGVVTAHRAGGQDCDGTCCDQAPMRSLPARRATSDASLEPADRSTPGHPQGQS